MLKFSKHKGSKRQVQTPKGKRLYAIGDVHGCYKALDSLLSRIQHHDEGLPTKKTFYVFLGDLIDRGPDSARVIEFLRNKSLEADNYYFLTGNHEEVFLQSIDGDLESLERWLSYGGHETLQSYGVKQKLLLSQDFESIWRKMKKVIPETHIDFIRSFVDSIEFGDYFLAHAGIDPYKPLKKQNRQDLLWIREPFLSFKKPLEKVVIHGHTIEKKVKRYTHRISVDTGAYNGGPLSAVCLEGTDMSILRSKDKRDE